MIDLFHITPSENIPSIMEHGLLPGYRRGLFVGARQRRLENVYLTSTPVRVIKEMGGLHWGRMHKPSILTIDINGLEPKPLSYDAYINPLISDFEYTVDFVPAKNIVHVEDALSYKEIENWIVQGSHL